MELVFELFLGLLGELALQLVAEFALELGWESTAESLRRRRKPNPWISGPGCLVLGMAVGGLMLLILPRRLTPPAPFPGLSLVVAPVLTGLVMHGYGERRRAREQPTSALATFPGGALFALGAAGVRYAFVG